MCLLHPMQWINGEHLTVCKLDPDQWANMFVHTVILENWYGLQISRFYKYMICKDHRQVLDTSKYWFAVIQEF